MWYTYLGCSSVLHLTILVVFQIPVVLAIPVKQGNLVLVKGLWQGLFGSVMNVSHVLLYLQSEMLLQYFMLVVLVIEQVVLF